MIQISGVEIPQFQAPPEKRKMPRFCIEEVLEVEEAQERVHEIAAVKAILGDPYRVRVWLHPNPPVATLDNEDELSIQEQHLRWIMRET